MSPPAPVPFPVQSEFNANGETVTNHQNRSLADTLTVFFQTTACALLKDFQRESIRPNPHQKALPPPRIGMLRTHFKFHHWREQPKNGMEIQQNVDEMVSEHVKEKE